MQYHARSREIFLLTAVICLVRVRLAYARLHKFCIQILMSKFDIQLHGEESHAGSDLEEMLSHLLNDRPFKGKKPFHEIFFFHLSHLSLQAQRPRRLQSDPGNAHNPCGQSRQCVEVCGLVTEYSCISGPRCPL